MIGGYSTGPAAAHRLRSAASASTSRPANRWTTLAGSPEHAPHVRGRGRASATAACSSRPGGTSRGWCSRSRPRSLYDPQATDTWSDGPELMRGAARELVRLGGARRRPARWRSAATSASPVGAEVLRTSRRDDVDGRPGQWPHAVAVQRRRGRSSRTGKRAGGGRLVLVRPRLHRPQRLPHVRGDSTTRRRNTWTAGAPTCTCKRVRRQPARSCRTDGCSIAGGREAETPRFTETASSQTYRDLRPRHRTPGRHPRPADCRRAPRRAIVGDAQRRAPRASSADHSAELGVRRHRAFGRRSTTRAPTRGRVSIPLGTERSGAIAVALPDDSVLVTSGFWVRLVEPAAERRTGLRRVQRPHRTPTASPDADPDRRWSRRDADRPAPRAEREAPRRGRRPSPCAKSPQDQPRGVRCIAEGAAAPVRYRVPRAAADRCACVAERLLARADVSLMPGRGLADGDAQVDSQGPSRTRRKRDAEGRRDVLGKAQRDATAHCR